jgi:hypothetical protein
MLAVFGTMLPNDHTLSKSMYESVKLLHALKMSYESIHACRNGCVLFRGKELEAATHCPKCKASRYVEVDVSDARKMIQWPKTDMPMDAYMLVSRKQ